jgi:hypothetical protein
LARTCSFDHLEKSLIKDRLVLGVGDSGLKERLLRTQDLDLQKAYDICRAAESSRQQIKELDGVSNRASEIPVDAVGYRRKQEQLVSKPKPTPQTAQPKPRACSQCGYGHGTRAGALPLRKNVGFARELVTSHPCAQTSLRVRYKQFSRMLSSRRLKLLWPHHLIRELRQGRR